MFLDGGQQSGAVGVADLSGVEVVLWVQQLKTNRNLIYFVCAFEGKKGVETFFYLCTSFPVDMTATTGNLCTLTSVTPTVASRPISDGPMCVPLASTHSPRLMSCPIGLQVHIFNLTSQSRLHSQCLHHCAVSYLMSCPGRACTMILTSSSSVPCKHPSQSAVLHAVAK